MVPLCVVKSRQRSNLSWQVCTALKFPLMTPFVLVTENWLKNSKTGTHFYYITLLRTTLLQFYQANVSYTAISGGYIVLQCMKPKLPSPIFRGDNYQTTAAIETIEHYGTYLLLLMHEVMWQVRGMQRIFKGDVDYSPIEFDSLSDHPNHMYVKGFSSSSCSPPFSHQKMCRMRNH